MKYKEADFPGVEIKLFLIPELPLWQKALKVTDVNTNIDCFEGMALRYLLSF